MDPFTLFILGSLATAGSVGANAMAQSRVNKAREGAQEAERIRQNKLQQEAEALNAQSQDRYKDFGQQQEDKGAKLAEFFQGQNQAIPQEQGTPSEGTPDASNIVVRETAKQAGKAKAFSDQQAGALGKLRSFGDLLGDTSRLQGRDAAQVNTLGGFMKGSSQVLPYELEAANQKGSGLRMLGDILGLAGTAASGYGVANGGLSGVSSMFSAAKPVVGAVPGGASKAATRGLTYFTGY